jgi:hypothetical protein
VTDIVRKAKEMQLERVEAMCVDHCRRGVSVHNAVAWFVRAHVHGLEAGYTRIHAHIIRALSARTHSPPHPPTDYTITGARSTAWGLFHYTWTHLSEFLSPALQLPNQLCQLRSHFGPNIT